MGILVVSESRWFIIISAPPLGLLSEHIGTQVPQGSRNGSLGERQSRPPDKAHLPLHRLRQHLFRMLRVKKTKLSHRTALCREGDLLAHGWGVPAGPSQLLLNCNGLHFCPFRKSRRKGKKEKE